MKTVPTLCATATVVGASAVGLSFGRKTPFDPSHANNNNNKRVPPARELLPVPMPTAVQTAAPVTTTASSFGAPVPVASGARLPLATRLSYDGRSHRRTTRKMTSPDAVVQRPRSAVASYGPSDQDLAELDPPPHIATRRSSWMKRLSNISTSQQSSRNPSPSRVSPSVSYSNGSMAFSHDGSTAPIMGRRAPSPLPPNKLVKRSLSIRTPHDARMQSAPSRRPSFRRPATSHQRSATLQHQTALLERTVEDPGVDDQVQFASTDSEIEYAQFFTAKLARESKLTKRRASSAQAHGFRRIFPDDKHKPTLVLARSVTAGAEEADESTSDDGESIFFVSRPGTPPGAPQPVDGAQFHAHAAADHSDDASRPRRSFSITDLISSAAAKKQRLARAPSGRLSRRASQRVSSAPLVPPTGRRPHSTSGGAEARRDLTEPALAKRDIAACTATAESGSTRKDRSGSSSSSLFSALPDRRVDCVAGDGLASVPQLEVIASASQAANHSPPSPILAQSGVRPSRHSMAPSEQASTLVGSSDNEVRGLGSGDEDDADFQSETLFDSLRTGATRSTSGGARGPRIETIFDESPPAKIKVTALRDLLPPGAFGEHPINGVAGHQSIAEEEESISTPVRTVRPERSLQDSPSFARTLNAPLFPNLIPSSPPSMPQPLSLGTLEWDSRGGDDDNSSRWSLDEDDVVDPWVDLPTASHADTPASLLRHAPRLLASGSSPKPSTPQHLAAENADRDARSSIFDWSEQQPADKTPGNHTPPRPRTVHGKKDADRRGSRSVGRRTTSGLHARSQSVPVVPDATGKRTTVVTNKFGSWGVGSKGITEDWNDDFDFSEVPEEPAAEGSDTSPKLETSLAMVVPKTIQEQQNNVLANIGLLREWGLLIEELKEHRIRAVTLGIVDGPHVEMWEQVDAMIDLADQEADHEGVPRLSPPSSPGFDEDAFEDPSSASPSNSRRRLKSGSPSDDLSKDSTQSIRPRRKSILPPNQPFLSPQSSPVPPKSKFEAAPRIEPKPVITRPRKDSEAKARSVIEALQKRKSNFDQVADVPPTPSSKKVPFDTATLRRIVPYVSTLTRKVKDAIRDAEGLYNSPDTSPQHEEPPFSKIFQQDAELAAQMKLMIVM